MQLVEFFYWITFIRIRRLGGLMRLLMKLCGAATIAVVVPVTALGGHSQTDEKSILVEWLKG